MAGYLEVRPGKIPENSQFRLVLECSQAFHLEPIKKEGRMLKENVSKINESQRISCFVTLWQFSSQTSVYSTKLFLDWIDSKTGHEVYFKEISGKNFIIGIFDVMPTENSE